MRVERQYATFGARRIHIGWRFQLTRRSPWRYLLSDAYTARAIRKAKEQL